MKFKEFITELKDKTKNLIQIYENYKDLTGEQKKQRVDYQVKSWIETQLITTKLNVFVKFIIKTYILNHIPDITQAIFDLIKLRIQGITEEKA